jgi:hypothetical protein
MAVVSAAEVLVPVVIVTAGLVLVVRRRRARTAADREKARLDRSTSDSAATSTVDALGALSAVS